MFVGSLFSQQSPVKCSYSYYDRGTKRVLAPDLFSEVSAQASYTGADGNLFSGKPVGFKAQTLAYIGVDIVFTLDKPIFVDHVRLNQGEGSQLTAVEVLSDGAVMGAFRAESGELTDRKEILVSVGQTVQELTVRIGTDFNDLILEQLYIGCAEFDKNTLFPLPNNRQDLGGELPLSQLQEIITTEPSDGMLFAARLLQEKLEQFHAISLPCHGGEQKPCSITFAFYRQEDANYGVPESYLLDIADGSVCIRAMDKRGFLYGEEALLMLIRAGTLPCVRIEDRPAHPLRGVHISTPPAKEDVEFFKRFVKYYLVPLRLNTMVMEIDGCMRYESHPEITEAWLKAAQLHKEGILPRLPHSECVMRGTLWEKEDLAELVRYVKSFGIEVIPEVQSLAHVQYITLAHPEIGEVLEGEVIANIAQVDGTTELERFPAAHCYCPSHPKSLEIMLDILDEMIEVFQPERYVHMGHDEAIELGCCPRCKDKDPSQLLADHINALYDHLAKYGLKMMLWSDMLQDHTRNPWQYLMSNTFAAGKLIPKDIVIFDFMWYFMPFMDTDDCLLNQGFPVCIGNFYAWYPRFTSRIRKEGAVGGVTSVWDATSEYTFARQGKLFEFAYTANMLWNDAYDPQYHTTYSRLLGRLLPRFRQHIRNTVEPVCSTPLLSGAQKSALPVDALQLTQHGIDGVLRVGAQASKELPVNGCYSHLAFLHASEKNARRNPWLNLVEQGEYLVTYADGTSCRIPLEYGGNICELHRAYGKLLLRGGYAHQCIMGTYFSDPVIQTRNDRGEDLTVYRYLWTNPNPEKEIVKITAVKNDTTDGDILLFDVQGESC